MRPNQNQNQPRRMRGRNNNNRKGPNPLSRSFESAGPDIKIRGTAQHIAEKYSQLARDLQSSGDRVQAENYLQHAEHYYRIIAAAQEQFNQQFGQQERFEDDDDVGEEAVYTGVPEEQPDIDQTPHEFRPERHQRFDRPDQQRPDQQRSDNSSRQDNHSRQEGGASRHDSGDRPARRFNNPRHERFSRHDGPRDQTPRDLQPRDQQPRENGQRDYNPRDNASRDNNTRDNGSRDNGSRDYAPRDYSSRDHNHRDNGHRDHAPRDHNQRDHGQRDMQPRDTGYREPASRENGRSDYSQPVISDEQPSLPAFLTTPVRVPVLDAGIDRSSPSSVEHQGDVEAPRVRKRRVPHRPFIANGSEAEMGAESADAPRITIEPSAE